MNKPWFPYANVVGWLLTLLIAFALTMSAYFKLSGHPEAVKGFETFGYPQATLMPIGVVEIAGVVLLLVPQTSLFGLALLTAYLGGAVATHVRVGDPFAPPIVMGVLMWVGTVLRFPAILRAPYSPHSETPPGK